MRWPSWINAVLRSLVWLGAAAWLAYLKSPDEGGVLAVRGDAIGWLGGGLLLAGLALHLWSNVSLALGESNLGATRLVVEGPYRYVRNPIYLAGIPLLVGAYLLYANWNPADLVAAIFLLAFFHLRVVRFEEPALRKLHGTTFEEYCRRVPRWIPRLATTVRAADPDAADVTMNVKGRDDAQ